MSGLQCKKRLWQQVHAPLPYDEQGTSSAATWGTYVGERARELFANGVLIPAHEIGREKAKLATAHALADPKTKAIFEATFAEDGVQVRVDILERVRDGWILNEVKSSTSVKDEYIPDVATQLFVLRAAGVAVKKVLLCHVDNTYVRGARLSLDRVFHKEDVTEAAEAFLPEVPKHVAEFRRMLAKKTAPAIEPSSHCFDPYECEFWGRCTAGKPDDWVFHMPGQKAKLLADLAQRGIERISKIPDDAPMSANQRIVRDAHRDRKPWISDRLADALKATRGPCAYLDFETFAPAIPLYAGTRPYQALPFQWSLHVRNARRTLTHKMFLADGDVDPRAAFLETLLDAVETTSGPILVYSVFERQRLNELRIGLSGKKAKQLDATIERLFDLLQVVRSHIYMPEFQFSRSIKTVGPALAPTISYDGLEIGDGSAASDAFARLAMGLIDNSTERIKVRKSLETYCALDTKALALVHEALLRF